MNSHGRAGTFLLSNKIGTANGYIYWHMYCRYIKCKVHWTLYIFELYSNWTLISGTSHIMESIFVGFDQMLKSCYIATYIHYLIKFWAFSVATQWGDYNMASQVQKLLHKVHHVCLLSFKKFISKYSFWWLFANVFVIVKELIVTGVAGDSI